MRAIGTGYECIEKTSSATFGGLKIRYAYLSQRGFYPDDEKKPNQDCYSVTTEFVGQETDALFGVYDGHGRDGDKCAQFSRDHLPSLMARHIIKAKNEARRKGVATNAEGSIELTKEQIQNSCVTAHKQTNLAMHNATSLDDGLSGTTAISCYMQGRRNRITICNVGDSRAVLGQRVRRQTNGGTTDGDISESFRALPLSRDQTPYRRDERMRIREKGARILSLDQIEGLEPIHEEEDTDGEWSGTDVDLELGEELDEGGDPPRVWHPHQDYPGTAFTRSLGDSLAEELGVFAEPEMVTRELEANDKIIVLASDGVFEFLTNQSVIDICAKFNDPVAACKAVVAESYELWLQYELRTDDITMICIFIDSVDKEFPQKEGHIHSNSKGNDNPDIVKPGRESRPVRQTPSIAKTQKNAMLKATLESNEHLDEEFDISQLYTEKTQDEKACISQAIKASVMLQNITGKQRDMIYGVMEPIVVRKGDWIIRQGTVGDRFYIVEQGSFEVRILPEGQEDERGNGGNLVHVYHGSKKSHVHPTFGELSLMYSAPRAATIIAQTDGKLWALHRYAFRKVLVEQGGRQELLKVLRKIDKLKQFKEEEIEDFAGSSEEATYRRGKTIIHKGDSGETLYVISKGSAVLTLDMDGTNMSSSLKAGDYFGQEVMGQGGKQYMTTVVTESKTTCWKIEKSTITRTMKKIEAMQSGSNEVTGL